MEQRGLTLLRRLWPDSKIDRAAAVVLVGFFLICIYYAMARGGRDFAVFHTAWRLVLEGRGSQIYTESPDRFLYAPGFAWLFAPLGWISMGPALFLWSALKAILLSAALIRASRRLGAPLWIAVMALLSLARPLLIDFQYGQINALIVAVCWLALSGGWRPIEWAGVAFAGMAKIYPLPLVLLPWLVPGGIDRRRARWVVFAVATLVLVIPVLVAGWQGGIDLHRGWLQALQSKGLPLESHNQSFSAWLNHWFSGKPTHIIALYQSRDLTVAKLLSEEWIARLTLAWALLLSGAILAWIIFFRKKFTSQAQAVLLGLLVIPSHLVWKPYFVFGIPAALELWSTRRWWAGVALFALINLTSVDVVGLEWGARLEGGCLLLWTHLALLSWSAVRAGRSSS